MTELFEKNAYQPLAERCRPKSLNDYVGQKHVLASGKIINTIIKRQQPISLIFWGEPGCGKTTLAEIIANECDLESYFLSAISSGVSDVRAIIKKGQENRRLGRNTLLFLDEIHRFSKSQQDSVLGAVERGDIILIGATTENPSFQVIAPLLSRVRIIRLHKVTNADLRLLLERVLTEDKILQTQDLIVTEDAKNEIINFANGDARRLYNILEFSSMLATDNQITSEIVQDVVKDQGVYFDKGGDKHYDTISAFIKSMRGSDPNAAIYYLTRMLEAGEDPMFLARRLVIFASEDVGNAAPQGLTLATSTLTAVQNIGMPEAGIILAQCTTFLASCPKSNASYQAYGLLKSQPQILQYEIPLKIRNAPTKMMKDMGYKQGYKYPHDYPNHFVENENYLPKEIADQVFYHPSEEGSEKNLKRRLAQLWPKKYSATNE